MGKAKQLPVRHSAVEIALIYQKCGTEGQNCVNSTLNIEEQPLLTCTKANIIRHKQF